MNKAEFLANLRTHLSSLSKEEVDEIIRDQEEYILDAVKAGRSEESVIASLGDPKLFAASLLAEVKLQQAEQSESFSKQLKNTFNAVIAILALAPLNFILAFGPFLLIICLVIAGWATAFGGIIASIAFFWMFFYKLIFFSIGFWGQLASFFLALGWIGLATLGLLFMYQITRFFLLAILAYLKWNLKFIKGRIKD